MFDKGNEWGRESEWYGVFLGVECGEMCLSVELQLQIQLLP